MIEKLATLPAEITVKANEHRTIIVNSLETSVITLEADASLNLIAILSEGWEENKVITFNMEGKQSSLNFLALILAKDQNAFPFETISKHNTTNTHAACYVRSAMFDSSSINYKGILVIPKESQITDSYLAHHTLMLSEKSKAVTIPSLEIEADDVQAGHAATIGRVDDELLFYLTSRGIDKTQATDMLIRGFIEADIDKIDSEEARKVVLEEVQDKLECLI